MDAGFSVEVVELDPDYTGVSLRAWNERFSASTFIFAGLTELSAFADVIDGFPTGYSDDRSYEFGKLRGLRFAGGYCRVDLQYRHPSEGAFARIYIQDDTQRFSDATAGFSIPVEAASLDRFVSALKAVESARSGCAVLRLSD